MKLKDKMNKKEKPKNKLKLLPRKKLPCKLPNQKANLRLPSQSQSLILGQCQVWITKELIVV